MVHRLHIITGCTIIQMMGSVDTDRIRLVILEAFKKRHDPVYVPVVTVGGTFHIDMVEKISRLEHLMARNDMFDAEPTESRVLGIYPYTIDRLQFALRNIPEPEAIESLPLISEAEKNKVKFYHHYYKKRNY